MASVLIVEDSLSQATHIRLALKKAGFDVYVAENGQRALDILQSHSPDLVLTDLQMPVMDGLQLVEAMRSQHPRIPVVLMTQHGSEEIALQALRKGAASYLPKSRLDGSMVEVLEDLLETVQVVGEQNRVRQCLVERVSQFQLENDPTLIPAVASFVEKILADTEFGDPTTRLQIGVALRNALDQAIFHGNLEFPPEARLDGELAFRELAEERLHTEPYQGRSVWLTVALQRDRAEFIVRHEGAGVPADLLPSPDSFTDLDNPLRRALVLIRTFMDEVHMNAAGTELKMVKFRGLDTHETPKISEHDSAPTLADQVTDVEAPPVLFRGECNDDVLIVTIAREGIGFAEYRRVQEVDHLLHRLAEENLHRVVVDFGEVEGFGSAVLESLLSLWKAVAPHPDGRLACCRVAEPGRLVMQLAKFDTVWPIYDTREAALAAVRSREE